ncbi:MAG: RidA family protein [Lachnospiraceae bacterium]|nr:RidA family protein [Lachnospiraceae bacterium]
MKAEKITTKKAPEPGGWYSQAFRVGDLVYTAGVTAHDPVTQQLAAPGDMAQQTRQVLRNLEQILLEAGSDLEHVFKTLVFVADIDQFDVFNEAYKEFFPENPPARSTMEIGKFKNGMMIEIEAIATVR